jgi:CubicO group peptidase (beta-lactamase class C family)
VTDVHGSVAPGFEGVRAAFADAVSDDGPGAALAAVVDGETVVDLYAGRAGDRPWQEDTICIVFSGTKGVVAAAVLVLVERGVLDLEAPVSRIWPEFAVAGKEDITVGDVLAHAAGLPGVTERLTLDDLAAPERIFELLAAQAPLVAPGGPSYHALTYGWLVDAIVRRADGRHVAQVVADELCAPLHLDFRIGTHGDDLAHVAPTVRAPDFELSAFAGNAEPDPRLDAVYGNPPLSPARGGWNDPAVLEAEIPAGNGVGTARSIARLFGCLARGGELDGVRILRPETIELGARERSRGADPLSGRPLRFGAGFELHGTPSRLGPVHDAFGHTGSGGSSHGAWPSLRTGFSFVISELRTETADQRAPEILYALRDAVAS